ncbi:MAG TPA: isoleucine--tRNA ligase [Myxococcales bacterium]|nr:isoleucine--tRNA ligase [Myxococcales bacterium]
MDLKDTVNLPKTGFPMRAQLAEREPAQVKAWLENKIYEHVLRKNAGQEKFVMHDGPPYANGSLHLGHFLNKVLKDVVVKRAAMSGKLADFVPGWDCHGLPIEQQVDKQLGPKKRQMSASDFRRACRRFADEQVEIQRREFQRLGVMARWDDPYLTMQYAYEAHIVRQLAAIARKGAMYRRKRPVHWCIVDVTALAEAEVEYAERTSPSIYVAFRVLDGTKLYKLAPSLKGHPLALAIWTTTPWTIPANLAIAANPEIEYVAYDLGKQAVIVAKDLLAQFLAAVAPDQVQQGGGNPETVLGAAENAARVPRLRDARKVLAHFSGEDLAGVTYHHPLVERTGSVVLGAHPTTEAGTGLVHTAPGHGEDDFQMGIQYGLPIWAPVDERGRFTEEAGIGLGGKKVFDANPEIIEKLREAGALLNAGGRAFEIRHSYPHCWRCKNPVIFRATDQWWIGLDVDIGGTTIRKAALAEIDRIAASGGWIPAWGKDRIRGMVENRPDWCISRQRSWGVPIPVAYCAQDREPLVSAEAMEHVARVFEQHGADAWFDKPLTELLPAQSRCPKCKGTQFEKETDILDVWFDSGSSWAAVLASGRWPELRFPADLYLEGSDQHRGWFNSSLTIAVATRGESPYRACLTHGFVVAEDGRKMSKSLGNYVDPQQTLKKYGAEIVRLWVAASDYRDDVRLSPKILETLSEGYRKIRNTLRYCLSQLYDFDPARDSVPLDRVEPIDRWALSRLERYRAAVTRAYDQYEFHRVYHATVDLSATDLSAFYFDVLKDRTYCSAANSPLRRAAQTVLYRACRDLCRLLAPIASFTTEEVWQHLPGEKEVSVFLAGLPDAEPQLTDDALEEEFRHLLSFRRVVNEALEAKRTAKEIGKATEADVTLRIPREPAVLREVAEKYEASLADLFLAATVRIESGDTLSAEVKRSACPACERCWRALPDVSGSPALCDRCKRAVAGEPR